MLLYLGFGIYAAVLLGNPIGRETAARNSPIRPIVALVLWLCAFQSKQTPMDTTRWHANHRHRLRWLIKVAKWVVRIPYTFQRARDWCSTFACRLSASFVYLRCLWVLNIYIRVSCAHEWIQLRMLKRLKRAHTFHLFEQLKDIADGQLTGGGGWIQYIRVCAIQTHTHTVTFSLKFSFGIHRSYHTVQHPVQLAVK